MCSGGWEDDALSHGTVRFKEGGGPGAKRDSGIAIAKTGHSRPRRSVKGSWQRRNRLATFFAQLRDLPNARCMSPTHAYVRNEPAMLRVAPCNSLGMRPPTSPASA